MFTYVPHDVFFVTSEMEANRLETLFNPTSPRTPIDISTLIEANAANLQSTHGADYIKTLIGLIDNYVQLLTEITPPNPALYITVSRSTLKNLLIDDLRTVELMQIINTRLDGCSYSLMHANHVLVLQPNSDTIVTLKGPSSLEE